MTHSTIAARRILYPLAIVGAALVLASLGSCSEEEAATTSVSPIDAETYSAGGRDRLCLKEASGRAGLIAFAPEGDANCSLRGELRDSTLRPDGDAQCALRIDRQADRIAIAEVPAGCSYYCGPGASLAGKTFVRMDRAEPVTDVAGDPLC